jgi:hypothetical protein
MMEEQQQRKHYIYIFRVYQQGGTITEIPIPANCCGDAADALQRRIPDAVNITLIGRK